MVAVPPEARRLLGDDTTHWTPWTNDRWESVGHIHLYRLAQTLAGGGRVIVLGSGEGFGAAMLAEVAEHVLAIEPYAEAVLHARYNYRAPNLLFSHGEPHKVMPNCDEGSLDLIVVADFGGSVEVAQQLIAWAPKLLRADGVLLMSVPGRTESEQFGRMLRERFPEVAVWRQEVGSRFVSLTDPQPAGLTDPFVVKEKDIFLASAVEAKPRLQSATPDAGSDALDLLDWVDAIGDREAASGDTEGIPQASIDLAWSLTLDETRLRRQVVAYDAGMGRAVADAREARREAEVAHANQEIVEIELGNARTRLDEAREQLEGARSEADALRGRLEAIEGSRAYRTVRNLAAKRPSANNR